MPTQSVDGAVLYYEEHGSGPPLLLIHGTGAFADVWSPVLDGLSRRHRVINYDRRGFARSSGTAAQLASSTTLGNPSRYEGNTRTFMSG